MVNAVEVPERLETERLLLRKPELADAGPISSGYASDPEVTRYLTWKAGQGRTEIETFLAGALDHWAKNRAFTWTILRKGVPDPIGMIDVRLETHAQLGYVLDRAYWNCGLMTEAVRAILDWALSRPDIHRVWAVCDVENQASARVMEKAGMQREGVLRKYMIFPNRGGEPRDCYCYARVRP